MSYYAPPNAQQPPYGSTPSNLQFYQSSYAAPVSGHTTPSQAQYGGNSYNQASSYPSFGGPSPGFGGAAAFGGANVSGRMGEQGGLRTGWLAAFGTEGYDGEPPLLEELGVNFGHIKSKVCGLPPLSWPGLQSRSTALPLIRPYRDDQIGCFMPHGRDARIGLRH